MESGILGRITLFIFCTNFKWQSENHNEDLFKLSNETGNEGQINDLKTQVPDFAEENHSEEREERTSRKCNLEETGILSCGVCQWRLHASA